MKRVAIYLLAALAATALTGCGGAAEETPANQQIFAMDTLIRFTVYGEMGEDTIQGAVEEVQRLEKLLDRTDPDSEVGFLNGKGGQTVQVGEEVRRLIETAGTYTDATGGAFDITIAPVMDAWGFTTDSFQVPAQAELDTLLGHVGTEHIHLSGDAAVLDPGTTIDLGGIAKGYASDCLAEIFAESGMERGWADLGGNVLAWGTRPDGESWRVGVQHPEHPGEEPFVGTIGLKNAFAVTSGGYQRFFEENGRSYHHIIDPATGYPADSGLTSVTVVAGCETAGNGTMCDALSTALFVMGEEAAVEFWRGGGYDFDMILVTEDGRVIITSGIAEQFTEAEGSGYTYETVS